MAMTSLTPADIPALRANSAPIPTTIAPATSANAFKSALARNKPCAKTQNHHFSIESRNFKGSALKKSASVASTKKIISLGTGRPTADYYPWKLLACDSMSPTGLTDQDIREPTLQTITKDDLEYNLALAMNYGGSAGSPHLLRFMTEHVEIVHNPPYGNWGVCLTAGATSAMEIAYRIFCNRGDNVLMEDYTFPGTVEGAKQLDLRLHGVPMDTEGASAEALGHILNSWDLSQGPKPRIFYTIPSGQNPTGATQSLRRRKEIYQIAEQHDLIIIEDDPYYFLRVGSRQDPEKCERIPTYLSIDTSGRVVRLDSTSKILAPGLRAGWVTASSEIIEKFIAYQEVSTVAVSGPSQLMLWKLLDQSWGHEGFFTWLDNLSLEYRARRDIIINACERYLDKDICSWVEPSYGMFLWICVDWKKHPLSQDQRQVPTPEVSTTLSEIEDRILSTVLANGVQVTKGSLFKCNRESVNNIHFRMTFAAAAKEDLEEGVRIFADAVNKVFALNV